MNQFVIPKDYFDMNPIDKKEMCRTIIKKTLERIKATASPETAIHYVEKTLKKTELDYAEIEDYESSQIFLDLQNMLKEEFSIHHSQDTPNNQL